MADAYKAKLAREGHQKGSKSKHESHLAIEGAKEKTEDLEIQDIPEKGSEDSYLIADMLNNPVIAYYAKSVPRDALSEEKISEELDASAEVST